MGAVTEKPQGQSRHAGHAGGRSCGFTVFGENQEYNLPRPRGLLWDAVVQSFKSPQALPVKKG